MESFLNKLLREIAKDKGIKLEFLSYNYVAKMNKDGKTRYVVGCSFGNNSTSSSKMATDKCCTYEVLKSYNIPIIEHHFVNEENTNLEFTKKYNYDVVVKPNKGSEGKDVLHLTNLEDIVKHTNKVVRYEKSAAICPFYNIKHEYRTFYLDGESLLTYDKQRPYVIGDGINTVEDLIKSNSYKYLKTDEMTENQLKYIPQKAEQVCISWKHNLSLGAKPNIVKDKEKLDKIHKLVEEAAKAIGITFSSIDVIELDNGELMILEINSSVTMTKFVEYEEYGHAIAKDIYSKAIDKLFE